MAYIRIAARARDEAGNVVSGDGFEIRAYQAGSTAQVNTYLDSGAVNLQAQPGRPSTSTSTTISSSASAGQAVINVASTTGFSTGDIVHIAGGGNREEGLIKTINSATQMTLAANLLNTYASGSVGGPEDKGAWVRYVQDNFSVDVEIKVVATGKTYPRVTFPTGLVVQRQSLGVLGATPTINLALGASIEATLGANITTLTLNNPVAGTLYRFRLLQDATGGRTIAWPASWKWPGAVAPTLSAANKVDRIDAYYDGTNFFGQSSLNY